MHRDRLRLAADEVEKAAALDLTTWPTCALTVLCGVPAFAALGLRPNEWLVVAMPPNLIGYECAEALFGIDTPTAYRLFSKAEYEKEFPGQAVTGPMVAARLRELANTSETP